MPFPTSSFATAGRFTAIRPIGSGAAGQVYYAEDNLGRAVAVKEGLPLEQGFFGIRAKFQKESRLQAALQHPNIVAVYHLEEDPQTQELYLICEYAGGGSLADHLERHGPLPEAQAVAVALDICAALEATWSRQIVHRDVKPSNILLFCDAAGRLASAKLGDFGIAQDHKARRTTALPGTTHPGTPLYMAPEQASITMLIDVRADIYALGVTLWEMLAGQDYKLLLAQGDPPELRRFCPEASPGLAAVLKRALQNDPALRYPLPAALAADLRAVRDGAPMTRRLVQRQSLLASGVLLAAVSTAGALAFGQVGWLASAKQPTATQRPVALAVMVDSPARLASATLAPSAAPSLTPLPTPSATASPAPSPTASPAPSATPLLPTVAAPQAVAPAQPAASESQLPEPSPTASFEPPASAEATTQPPATDAVPPVSADATQVQQATATATATLQQERSGGGGGGSRPRPTTQPTSEPSARPTDSGGGGYPPPDATSAPTSQPEATSQPNATSQPDATSEPKATSEPDATSEPKATSQPDATSPPSATSEPKATSQPDPKPSSDTSNPPADPSSGSGSSTGTGSTPADPGSSGTTTP